MCQRGGEDAQHQLVQNNAGFVRGRGAAVMKVAKLRELLRLFASPLPSPAQQLQRAACPAWRRFTVTNQTAAPHPAPSRKRNPSTR